jgi:hypothetical protein
MPCTTAAQTTDARAIGGLGRHRALRDVCFQDVPEALLPDELRAQNRAAAALSTALTGTPLIWPDRIEVLDSHRRRPPRVVVSGWPLPTGADGGRRLTLLRDHDAAPPTVVIAPGPRCRVGAPPHRARVEPGSHPG